MKNLGKILIVAGVIILLIIAASLSGKEEKEELKLNYTMKEDGKTYIIDNKSYVETDKKTDIVKIDVKDLGIIIAELYPKIAPITVKNFKKLVSEEYYSNITFHRVIKDFMIQCGDPTGIGTGGSEETIKGEFSENGIKNDLSHNRGVLSMARRGADPDTDETRNSASSQFFIVHKDSDFLDGKYAAFGKVVNGIEIVDKIASVQVDSQTSKPLNDVIINSITFVEKVGD